MACLALCLLLASSSPLTLASAPDGQGQVDAPAQLPFSALTTGLPSEIPRSSPTSRSLPYVNYTASSPTIDGTFSGGEWADAATTQIGISGNEVVLLMMYNDTHLFIAVDALSDITNDATAPAPNEITNPTADYVFFSFDGDDSGDLNCLDPVDNSWPEVWPPTMNNGTCTDRGAAIYPMEGRCGWWNVNTYANPPQPVTFYVNLQPCNNGLVEPLDFVAGGWAAHRRYEYSIPYGGANDPLQLSDGDSFGLSLMVNDAKEAAASQVIARYPPTANALTPFEELTLRSAPQAIISSPPMGSTYLVAEEVPFSASGSLDRNATIVDYDWDFDDGYAASGLSTTHTFSDAGEFDVTLTVTDDGTPSPLTSTINRTVRILEDNAPPSILSALPPIGPASIDEGETFSILVDYDDANLDVGDSVNGSWSIDGIAAPWGVMDPIENSATFSFQTQFVGEYSAGVYDVSLTLTDVYDAEGLGSDLHATTVHWQLTVEDVNRQPLIASESPASAEAVSIPEDSAGQEFAVTATDPDGDTLSYSWTYDGVGQAATSTSYVLVPDFSAAGSHTLSVLITDSGTPHRTTSVDWMVTITDINRVPTLGALSPDQSAVTLDEGVAQEFSIDPIDADGDGISILWMVDGEAVGEPDVTHFTYAPDFDLLDDPGTKAVKVKVEVTDTGAFPLKATHQWDVTVRDVDRPPVIGTLLPATGTSAPVNGRVSFDASSATDPDGDLITYVWDLGDGELKSTSKMTHQYATVGTKEVLLTISADHGGVSQTDHRRLTIEVTAAQLRLVSLRYEATTPVTVGASVTLIAVVENNGTLDAAEGIVAFEAGPRTIGVRPLGRTLPAGETVEVRIAWQASAGEFSFRAHLESIAAEGYVVDLTEVTTQPLVVPKKDSHTETAGPGLSATLAIGLVVALALVAVIALIAMRRRSGRATPPPPPPPGYGGSPYGKGSLAPPPPAPSASIPPPPPPGLRGSAPAPATSTASSWSSPPSTGATAPAGWSSPPATGQVADAAPPVPSPVEAPSPPTEEALVSDATPAAPAEEQQSAVSGLLCPHCNEDIEADWKLCPFCDGALGT